MCGEPNINIADAPVEAIIKGELVLCRITLEKNSAITIAINAPTAEINNSLLLTTLHYIETFA
jgi:hypothetical protein